MRSLLSPRFPVVAMVFLLLVSGLVGNFVAREQDVEVGGWSHGKRSQANPSRTSEHSEGDEFGGSWFDDFENESGIFRSQGVSVEYGEVNRFPWHLPDWDYRRPIEIRKEKGNTLKDHQILVKIDRNWFDYSKTRDKGEDIRFLTGNGSVLDFWIKQWNVGGISKIWVKVSKIPIGSSMIYLYYGNDKAIGRSDRKKVFPIWESFEDYGDGTTAGSMPGWYRGKDGGTCRVSNNRAYHGKMSFYQNLNTGDDWQDGLRRDFEEPLTGKINVTFWYWETTHNHDGNIWVEAADGTKLAGIGTENPQFEWVVGPRGRERSNACRCGADYRDWTRGTMYLDLASNSVEFDFWQRGGEKWHAQKKLPAKNNIGSIGVGPDNWWYIDMITVKKYASPEPTVKIREEDSLEEGYVISETIAKPEGMDWELVSVTKNQPKLTYVNLTLINGDSGEPIQAYESLTENNIDITELNEWGIGTIRLRATLKTVGVDKAVLGAWGVEWKDNSSWRNSFCGNMGIRESKNITFRGDAFLKSGSFQGFFTTEAIEIPPDRTWDIIAFNRSVRKGTHVNISILDSRTDELLLSDEGITNESRIDLTELHAVKHFTVYFLTEFATDGSAQAILHDLAISWERMSSPVFVERITEGLMVMEDEPETGILNVEGRFEDQYTGIKELEYAVSYNSEPENITVRMNDTGLDVVDLAVNWTGRVVLSINCTNVYGLTNITNRFVIDVKGVNDPPIWIERPLPIIIKEDETYHSDYSLLDYVYDAEGDELVFVLTIEDDRLSVTLEENRSFTIKPPAEYNCTTELEIGVMEMMSPEVSQRISIPVSVMEVDDPTVVTLRTPANDSVLGIFNTTLEWDANDVDDDLSEVKFDLYLGTSKDPDLHTTGLRDSSITVKDLKAHETYYWTVKPNNAGTEGICGSGVWSFTVDPTFPVPLVRLEKPEDGGVVNHLEPELNWRCTEPDIWEPSYHVFLGKSPEGMEKVAITSENRFFPLAVEDGTTYYWKVIPYQGGKKGRCVVGMWSFEIDTSHVFNYTLISHVEPDTLEIGPGNTTGFNITVRNEGDKPLEVDVDIFGKLADLVEVEPTGKIRLLVGEERRVNGTVEIPADRKPGEYSVLIRFQYREKERTVELPIRVLGSPNLVGGRKNETEDVVRDNDGDNHLLFGGIGVGLLAILVFGCVLFLRKKKEDIEPKPVQSRNEGRYASGGPTYPQRQSPYSFSSSYQKPYYTSPPSGGSQGRTGWGAAKQGLLGTSSFSSASRGLKQGSGLVQAGQSPGQRPALPPGSSQQQSPEVEAGKRMSGGGAVSPGSDTHTPNTTSRQGFASLDPPSQGNRGVSPNIAEPEPQTTDLNIAPSAPSTTQKTPDLKHFPQDSASAAGKIKTPPPRKEVIPDYTLPPPLGEDEGMGIKPKALPPPPPSDADNAGSSKGNTVNRVFGIEDVVKYNERKKR